MDLSGTPYSLRVDLPSSTPSFTPFKDFLAFVKPHNPIIHYIVGFEISEHGKPHYQSIVWFTDPLPVNHPTKYRNWWKRHTPPKPPNVKKYQPVSLKAAIKPENLSIYCMKDSNFITNLDSKTLSSFETWIAKLNSHNCKTTENRKTFRNKCRDYIQSINKDSMMYPCYTDSWGDTIPEYYYTYLTKISQIYYDIYKSPMRRNVGLSVLMDNNLLSHKLYISLIFRNFFSS